MRFGGIARNLLTAVAVTLVRAGASTLRGFHRWMWLRSFCGSWEGCVERIVCGGGENFGLVCNRVYEYFLSTFWASAFVDGTASWCKGP